MVHGVLCDRLPAAAAMNDWALLSLWRAVKYRADALSASLIACSVFCSTEVE
jgi:hypothetical protein